MKDNRSGVSGIYCRWLSRIHIKYLVAVFAALLVLFYVQRNSFSPISQATGQQPAQPALPQPFVQQPAQAVVQQPAQPVVQQPVQPPVQPAQAVQPPAQKVIAATKAPVVHPPQGKDFCVFLPKGPSPPASPWWHYICLFERLFDETPVGGCKPTLAGNWNTCVDKKYLPGSPCLVYSFGIAGDFRFDDAMGRRGCTVFSFDPSMGIGVHQHSKNVTFKNMGLGITDIDDFIPRPDRYAKITQRWQIRTLKSIIKMLGHEKRFIDVLKFDVEGYEWDVMDNIIKDGLLPQIGQVLTEWHLFFNLPLKENLERAYNTVAGLKQNGLQLFFQLPAARFHRNLVYNSRCDTGYVNTLTSREKFYASLKK